MSNVKVLSLRESLPDCAAPLRRKARLVDGLITYMTSCHVLPFIRVVRLRHDSRRRKKREIRISFNWLPHVESDKRPSETLREKLALYFVVVACTESKKKLATMETAKVYHTVPVDDVEAATKTADEEPIVHVKVIEPSGPTMSTTARPGRLCILLLGALGVLAVLHMHVGCHHDGSSSFHHFERYGEGPPPNHHHAMVRFSFYYYS
jgi:hypothetical protein